MPIVQINGELVYFAHVPKCAGSAIENYLVDRFGPLGFLDRGFLKVPRTRRWTRSSPQHIHVNALNRLLPPSFFATRFAVVRHPILRLQSVYRFQRDIEGTIPVRMRFSDWLDSLDHLRRRRPFHLDNHFRPMTDFVPEDSVIFQLEDGLEPLVSWLDELAGNSEGPREIAPSNTYEIRAKAKRLPIRPVTPLKQTEKRKIENYCPEDFDRFGYAREPVE